MGVGVDHPRDEHLAAHVPDLGVPGHVDIGADRSDGASVNNQRSALNRPVGCGQNTGTGQSQHDSLL